MRAYPRPRVTPLTSCWRNSVAGARGSGAGRSRIDRRVVDLLPALDLQHHGWLGGVPVLVQRDHPGDAGVVLGRGDQIADLLGRRLARLAPRLGRGEPLERLG